MDEGDDYVPQMSQLGEYGMGMPPPPQQQQPYPQGMPGGMQQMTNPYDHQQQQHMMMMQQQQQHRNVPPQQQPVAANVPPKKARSSKKKSSSSSSQQSNDPSMDPMASMAAMSNNPMMRPSMGQMGPYQGGQMGMYPGQGYPGAAPGAGAGPPPPQAYRGGPPVGASGQYPANYPQMYPPQQQPRGYPPSYGYPQQPPFPQQGYPPQPQMRPQYPGQPQQPPGYWEQQPPQSAGQPTGQPSGYPGEYGQPSTAAPDWSRRTGAATSANPAGQPQQQQHPTEQARQHLYQLECDIHRIQQRLQQLYQSPRTPMGDQEMGQLQHNLQYVQAEHHRMMQMVQQQLAAAAAAPQPPTVGGPPPANGAPKPAATTPTGHEPVLQQQQQQQQPSTPVQVNQTGNQVQLNITSEKSRTLISVYHNYEGAPTTTTTTTSATDDVTGPFPSAGSSAASSNESKDSIVPPEPTPSVSHLQQTPYTQHPQKVMSNGIDQKPQMNGNDYQYSSQQRCQYSGSEHSNGVSEPSFGATTSTTTVVEPAPTKFENGNEEEEEEERREEEQEQEQEHEPEASELVTKVEEVAAAAEEEEDFHPTPPFTTNEVVEEEEEEKAEEAEEEEEEKVEVKNELVMEPPPPPKSPTPEMKMEEVAPEAGEEAEEVAMAEEDVPEEEPATPPMYQEDEKVEEQGEEEEEPVEETKEDEMASEAGTSEEKKEPSEEPVFTEPSTPAASTKRKRAAAYLPKAQKKKKTVDESEDDDDDFLPDKKSRKKAKALKKKREEEEPAGKYAEPEDDEDDEFLMPVEDATAAAAMAAAAVVDVDAMIIEKILNSRQKEGEEEQFLVKWKGRSYIHCDWKTAKELEEMDKRSAAKLKRYVVKKPSVNLDDEEDFNPDFTVVDRVVDVTVDEDGTEFALIKWKSLGYDEVTWEAVETVPAAKVDLWRERQLIDKAKVKEKPRPKDSEWRKIATTCVWKNGNTLREYQFEGVNWLLYCYYHQRNCILADEMGLGKTVQTITFLSKIYEYGIHGPFLIVVPLSTIQNWVREFETWTDMNAIVYHGSGHAREVLQQFEIFYSKEHSSGAGEKAWKKGLVKIDALITTFEMVVTDCEFLKKIPWRVCVIDEAHRLKNRNCKLLQNGLHAFRMEHRVLLTGTPLQNNIEELFSLLNFLHPQQFNSSQEFLEQFGNCQTDDQVQRLQEILKPMMLRRLKEDVEKSLQPKEETIIEVQLSDTQKKFYRAILERNFTHLCKGTSAPSLMNVMMELRKCCNHPFLINGAEETILAEFKLMHPEWDEETLQQKALIQASGKVVLIEKLLPKLRRDGHKVLIFSQMVKVLDLLEEFLVNSSYPFERIDGNIRGDLRQASIDRFSKENSDRFVFLLCTRAGGLGINLTAADTVIIFDSDWNPQNDLQAQARCHRIGQKKMVKVYRLVTANTYEREMFDKASLKLGLDKAVLQSTTALKESSTSLSKKDIEELLKKGAYGSIMDENSESSKFNEEDIDTILQRRTQTITLEAGQKGSLFAKASFNSSNNRGDDIDLDDPEFWTKWAEKAQVDVEKATATSDGKELIMQEPRKRTKRFEENSLKEEQDSDDSEDGAKKGKVSGMDRMERRERRKRRRDEEDGDYSSSYRPDELAIHKTEYFKVEKVLAQWGWGRWATMKKFGDLEMSEQDIEHMSRTLLLHCIREFRGDDRVRQFVFALIVPQGAKVPRADGSAKNSIYHQGWAALPEFNPPSFALDSSFQRHVHRYANKLMVKVDQLKHLELVILGSDKEKAEDMEVKWTEICLKDTPALTESFIEGWDAECDACLLIGVWRHGLENYEAMKADDNLCFPEKTFPTWPAVTDISLRFRRLVAASQRSIHDPVYERVKWTRREEQEFMRILKSFGIKDAIGSADIAIIDWERFRSFSPLLERKKDDELQEFLYCTLAMCTKAQGGELSAMDNKRAGSVDLVSARRAVRIMNRLHLTRKIHALADAKLTNPNLSLCKSTNMPSGWTLDHDKDLIDVCDQYGIDGLAVNVLRKPSFEKIVRPSEKALLKRVLEIVTTIEKGKWTAEVDVASIEDSDGEEKNSTLQLAQAARLAQAQQQAQSSRRGRKRVNPSTNDNDAKMRALMQQLLLASTSTSSSAANELTAAALLQTMLMPQMMGSSSSSSAAAAAAQQQQQQLQLVASMLAMSAMTAPAAKTPTTSAAAAAQQQQQQQQQQQMMALAALMQMAAEQQQQQPSTSKEPVVKKPQPPPPPPAKKEPEQQLHQQLAASGIGMQELMLLSQFPGDTRIPLINQKTKEKVTGADAPQLKDLATWLSAHQDYTLDLGGSAPASAKPSAPPTPAPVSVPVTPAANSPKLEPGEVKKSPTATVNIKTSCTLAIEDPVAVFNRATGELQPASKWPKTKDLATFLEANPELNVHSSCALIAQIILAKTPHLNRIGGDPDEKRSAAASGAATPSTPAPATPAPPLTPSTPAAASSSSSSAAQMAALAAACGMPTISAAAAASSSSSSSKQRVGAASAEQMAKQQMEAMQILMFQQAMIQQSVLMGANPYAMATTATTSATTSTPTIATSSSTPSTSKQQQQQQQQIDEMNPMIMQALMASPLVLQSLMMSDPATAMALAAAAQQQQQQQQQQQPGSSKKSKQ